MTKSETAAAYFAEGFNCAQSVVAAYAPAFDLDPRTALRFAGAFGGGIARSGQTCGAVTGAMMVLGLAYGQVTIADADAKGRCYAAALRFNTQFREAHGSLLCRELLGHDLSTPEGLAVHATGTDRPLCSRFVQDAVESLQTLLPGVTEDR